MGVFWPLFKYWLDNQMKIKMTKKTKKYIIDEVPQKFNQTLSTRIITNKEAFLLHYILSYMKKLCNDNFYQWNLTNFNLHSKFKRELFKSFFPFSNICCHAQHLFPCALFNCEFIFMRDSWWKCVIKQTQKLLQHRRGWQIVQKHKYEERFSCFF